jgi:hypothetical protein
LKENKTISKMKFTVTIATLLAMVSAARINVMHKRQMNADDVVNGNCKEFLFIFARGSTEPGNMV